MSVKYIIGLQFDWLVPGVALYVPRVLDSNSNMKMLRITSVEEEDVEINSMGIVEPKLETASGSPREDGEEIG